MAQTFLYHIYGRYGLDTRLRVLFLNEASIELSFV